MSDKIGRRRRTIWRGRFWDVLVRFLARSDVERRQGSDRDDIDRVAKDDEVVNL